MLVNSSLTFGKQNLLYKFFFLSLEGPCQTSDFHKQYCDKKKKQYCNILIEQCFLVKILLLLYKNSWNNHKLRFSIHTMNKKCLFIVLSQYCLQKLLVWREPNRWWSLRPGVPNSSPMAKSLARSRAKT